MLLIKNKTVKLYAILIVKLTKTLSGETESNSIKRSLLLASIILIIVPDKVFGDILILLRSLYRILRLLLVGNLF